MYYIVLGIYCNNVPSKKGYMYKYNMYDRVKIKLKNVYV